ncbi:unnamed protein product, partial [Ectocarpus sp. 12 AP-2014]
AEGGVPPPSATAVSAAMPPPPFLVALQARWTVLAAASAESAAPQPSIASLLDVLHASPALLWYSIVTLARSPPCSTRTPPSSTSKRCLIDCREPPPSDCEKGDSTKPETSTVPDIPGQAATKLWVLGSSRANSPPFFDLNPLLQQRSACWSC